MDIEARRERIALWAKIGLAGVAIVAVAPVVLLLIKGIVGLIVAGGLAFTAIMLAKPFSYWVANMRMKAIRFEAAQNPIETMLNLYREKALALEKAETSIQDFDTEIRNFADQVVDFKVKYPEEAVGYDELLLKMKEALRGMRSEHKEARAELEKFAASIQKAEAIYKMATAAARVTSLSGKAEAQVFAKIREAVAVDAVRTSLNRAFAGLDTALERRSDMQAALPAAQARATIEMPAARERVPVRRTEGG